MSRTSPFICFGAHQQPHSNIHVPNQPLYLLWGTSTATLKHPCPEPAPLSALGHINSHTQISMSRTSPFICFGAHQQPHSTILTLVTILDASFSESKARCRMGHEGDNKQWGKLSRNSGFLAKICSCCVLNRKKANIVQLGPSSLFPPPPPPLFGQA